jgi:methylated-DNA-protein-cysteine methyltransferase related protein
LEDNSGLDIGEAVYEVVRRIPAGSVATYGQVADMVERVKVTAREVGGFMSAAPTGVPWQRVVGAGGHLPIGKRDPVLKTRQRQLLESEGVEFLPNDCIDMARFQLRSDDATPGLFD